MKADDFTTEETVEEKSKRILKEAKLTAMGFLGRSHALYKRIIKGDQNPTTAGKAYANLQCFLEMAETLGIDKGAYANIVFQLSQKLDDVVVKAENDSRAKTLVQHRSDPARVALEERRLEVREKELEIKVLDRRPPEVKFTAPVVQPLPVESIKEEVVEFLVKSQLGYKRGDAEERVQIAFKPGMTFEQLIAASCQVK